MEKRERDIESGLRKQVEKMGGKFMKFTSPGNDGVPDRIAVLPGGRVWFVELKREGEKPTAIQKWQMEQLRKMGCNVALITGKQEARAWIWEVIGQCQSMEFATTAALPSKCRRANGPEPRNTSAVVSATWQR